MLLSGVTEDEDDDDKDDDDDDGGDRDDMSQFDQSELIGISQCRCPSVTFCSVLSGQ